MNQLSTYAKYNTEEDAKFLVELLERNDISYEISRDNNQLDHIYLGESLDPLYLLMILPADFMKVNRMLAEQAKIDFHTGSFTHYFDQFDEQELIEVIQHPNDWNAYDNEIARLLLAAKHQTGSKDTTALEYSTAYTPEKMELKWLVVGYIISLSILGVFVGSAIVRSKKTLQNGASVFLYDESSRRHGGLMIILGAAATVLFFSRILLH